MEGGGGGRGEVVEDDGKGERTEKWEEKKARRRGRKE